MKYAVSTVATSPGDARPVHHSHTARPVTAVRSSSNAADWMVPDTVPRIQVRRVRPAHLFSTPLRMSSSRCSAPKAFTTALQEIASANAPPTLVSHLLESCAAGATQRTDNVAANAI